VLLAMKSISNIFMLFFTLAVLIVHSCYAQGNEVRAATAKPIVAKPTAALKKAVRDYALAPSDVITVSVFGQAELSGDFTVSEEGQIAYPLLGAIDVRNLKTKQVEKVLISKLKEGLLVNPKVNVTVKSYRLVYINGQVQSPSGYPFVPGMTVRKLISIAGGFTERASRSRIFVISDSAADEAESRKIKLDAPVQPGDIVSVEESFF
jgi:polysaccharide biosynthesis/export protein VpsN